MVTGKLRFERFGINQHGLFFDCGNGNRIFVGYIR